MKTNRIFFAFVFSFLAVQFVTAQDEFWLNKSYTDWNKEEIKQIISDSPWSKVVGSSDKISTESYVTIRLRSAVPIRQALVRLKQIEEKYDKMKDKEKGVFDEQMSGVLTCPACVDNYVVSIAPPITKREVRSGVFALRNVKMESVKDTVYLINDKGEKRSLVHFVAPKSSDGEAIFFFPRLDENGNPLLNTESKSVSLILEIKGSQYNATVIPLSTKFDVTKMIVDEEVIF